MSGGVVFAQSNGGSGDLERLSQRIQLTAGAVPPGSWYLTVAATLVRTGGNITVPVGSLVVSDGKSVTIAGTGYGVAVGARGKPVWPWPEPWPLNLIEEDC